MNKALPFLALVGLSALGCDTSRSGSASASVTDAPNGLPTALRSDAFEYYGLGSDKPVRLEMIEGEGGLPQTGSRSFKLDKIQGDKAVYTMHQDGALQGQGDIKLSLEKDGLYTLSSTAIKLSPHSLELPAKLEIGDSWKDHTEMGERKIVLDNVLKVASRERVSTPGGTFDDALRVTSTGSGTMGAGPVELTTETWYVRGLGEVKQIIRITPKDKNGAKRTVTLQLAAPESATPSDAGGADLSAGPGQSAPPSGPPGTAPTSR